MPNVAQWQRSSGTTTSAGIVGNSSISDRARHRRQEASPEPHEQLHAVSLRNSLLFVAQDVNVALQYNVSHAIGGYRIWSCANGGAPWDQLGRESLTDWSCYLIISTSIGIEILEINEGKIDWKTVITIFLILRIRLVLGELDKNAQIMPNKTWTGVMLMSIMEVCSSGRIILTENAVNDLKQRRIRAINSLESK